jgi:hypothetical protein
MPLLAYLRIVGAALLALLWIADFYLPRPPIVQGAAAYQPTIRIHAEQKWPERVVLDTSAPVISVNLAASEANIQASPAADAPPTSREVVSKAGDAYAMLRSTDSRQAESARQDKRQSKKVAARSPKKKARPHIIMASPENQFAWFGFR